MTHKQISFIKSGIRIVGYILLVPNLTLGMIVLVVSEVVGILEEVNEEK